MLDVAVIDDPFAAMALLDPIKGRMLAALNEPASAAGLAARLDMPRQKINYHLRALESHGLVEPVEERSWGGLTERLFVATAGSYVVSPAALGRIAPDPARNIDRVSVSYLVALAARTVREAGALWREAVRRKKRLATLSIDTDIRFRSAADRAAFTDDLANAISRLVAKYHDEHSPGGRPHRLVIASYPAPTQARP